MKIKLTVTLTAGLISTMAVAGTHVIDQSADGKAQARQWLADNISSICPAKLPVQLKSHWNQNLKTDTGHQMIMEVFLYDGPWPEHATTPQHDTLRDQISDSGIYWQRKEVSTKKPKNARRSALTASDAMGHCSYVLDKEDSKRGWAIMPHSPETYSLVLLIRDEGP